VINLGGALACPISKQGSDLLDLYFPQGEAQEPIGFQDECVPEDLVRSSIRTSQCVTKTNVFKPTSVETESVFNGFLWSFGQFVDHDLDMVAENHTERVYSESHFFELAVSNCDEEDMVGNRINVISSAFDLSSVYNDAKPEIRSQVDPAFLAMHDIDELPIDDKDDKGNYICGDDRCNENPFLIAQHTIWAKHHNIIVEELNYALSVEETQDRDAVYEKAKQINIATYQKVIMEEFVPTLVGNLDGEYAYQGHMHSYEIMEANKQCRSGTWLPLGDTKVTPKLCMHLITSLLTMANVMVGTCQLRRRLVAVSVSRPTIATWNRPPELIPTELDRNTICPSARFLLEPLIDCINSFKIRLSSHLVKSML